MVWKDKGQSLNVNLSNVIHVPGLPLNLISCSKLSENNVSVIFTKDIAQLWISSGRRKELLQLVENANKNEDGLFELDGHKVESGTAPLAKSIFDA